MPVLVAARSEVWVCDRSLAEILGSNSARAWRSGCCEYCVVSGRGVCNELITRPDESYRQWCLVVCDLRRNLKNEEAVARVGPQRHKKKCLLYILTLKLIFAPPFLGLYRLSGKYPSILKISRTGRVALM